MNLSLTVQTSSTVSTPLSSSQDSNCNSVLDKMEDIPEEPERKVDMHNIRIKGQAHHIFFTISESTNIPIFSMEFYLFWFPTKQKSSM